MKQTDFRDVPDELWKRIEPLLAPFKRKRSGGSKSFHSARFLPGSSTNAGAAVAQKALSTNTSNAGTKPVSWRRSFAYFLRNMGKNRRRCPMASYGRFLAASAGARSKNQWLKASDATRRTEGEVAARSSPRGRSGYSSGSDGYWRQCA